MAGGGRRRIPMPVRIAVTGFHAVGGLMVTLALTALGVLLSGMQLDPAHQGGTGYLDFVLFFNAVLCLSPLAGVVIFLGFRVRRGEHWAWLSSLVFWAFVAATAPILTWLLPAPLPFALVPALSALAIIALLLHPQTRLHCADSED